MKQICIEKKFSYDNINISTQDQSYEDESLYDRPVLESERNAKGLLIGITDKDVKIGDDILYKYENFEYMYICHYLGKIVYILEI